MKSEARAVERVKVFCRVRPLLQRERDGWSYEEYCQQFGEDGQRLDANDTQQPATDATPESSDDDPATFITEKGRKVIGSLTPSVTMQPDGHSVTFQAPTAAHGEARLFQFDGNLNETCDQQTIYCERIYDLLEPEISPSTILVREDADRGVYIDGAAADCLSLMERGNANRAVSSTEMNAHSSRSHAILILRVERKEFAPPPASSDAPRSSERVKKARVYGRHISELKAINLSLSALGNCISALIVTVTPAVTEAPETLQTLQFGQRAMQVAVRAHRSALSVLDYRTLYEEMRQALDEEQQRFRQAEAAASDEKNRAAIAQDKLTKALLRVQHLEFELEAAQTATRHSSAPDVEGNDVERMKLELQQLVARHAQDVAQVKSACDRQIETYKRLAHEASQEWHEVEGELAGEKTQVLHTLQDLKEFKLRYFQLEEDTTERIAELVQDERDREKERDAALATVAALEKELKAIHAKGESQREKLQDQLDTDFVPKEAIQQMEALYEGAISKLQARVGCLESKSSNRRPKTPSNNNSTPGQPQRSLPEVRKPGMANRAVPRVGRLVPGAKTGSSSRLNSGLRVSSRILQ
ncbi:Kinesin-like protein [Phytophthora cactorum]|nr:Kinesin-like protein [Phytophthora cactorum]